jgi:hypothetical protein
MRTVRANKRTNDSFFVREPFEQPCSQWTTLFLLPIRESAIISQIMTYACELGFWLVFDALFEVLAYYWGSIWCNLICKNMVFKVAIIGLGVAVERDWIECLNWIKRRFLSVKVLILLNFVDWKRSIRG